MLHPKLLPSHWRKELHSILFCFSRIGRSPIGRVLGFCLGGPVCVLVGVVVEDMANKSMNIMVDLYSPPSMDNVEQLSVVVQEVMPESLPLRTSGRHIVDRSGQRVRLRCVNWYGAHMSMYVVGGLDKRPLGSMVKAIRILGFNCVRLPYSLELQLTAAKPAPEEILANPNLSNKSGMEVLDVVIRALAAQRLLVILNNHQGHSMWCCDESDGEGLWYTREYPEEVWISSLSSLATRYRDEPYVVGYDLRNEPRGVPDGSSRSNVLGLKKPTWGDGDPETDWAGAAVKGALSVSAVDPDALIVVEGIDFATDLRGVRWNKTVHQHPALLGRVVYEVHDYCWYHIDMLFSAYINWICIGYAMWLALQVSTRREMRWKMRWKSALVQWRLQALALAVAWSVSLWLSSYRRFEQRVSERWGFISDSDEAPIWLGEFGTNGIWLTDNFWLEVGEVTWWRHIIRYISDRELDYAYWALNGGKGTQDETFGLLEFDYASVRHPWILEALLH